MIGGVCRNTCPHCGGKIIVSVLYQRSYNYTVGKSCKLLKHYKISADYPMECAIAACEHFPDSCDVGWEVGDFGIDRNGKFIDFKYEE